MNIYIMGLRGYTKPYGGWESYIKNLIDNWEDESFKFTIYEMSNDKKEEQFIVNQNVTCKRVYVRKTGNFTMLFYSIRALKEAIANVKQKHQKESVFLVLGVRIGPIFRIYKKRLEKMGIKVIINPDGLEWKRGKWNFLIKKYLKFSEKTMIKSSDYIICDSLKIKEYIDEKYQSYKKSSTYIPYGTYLPVHSLQSEKSKEILEQYGLEENMYYLYVGRFIPENNIEMILNSFIKSNSEKKLVLVTNIFDGKFKTHLLNSTKYHLDDRIQILGSIYDKTVLSILRIAAYAYIHGHSAGGTNPSLLESITHTRLNLLFDVAFNREVCLDNAYYFSNEVDLKTIINQEKTIDNSLISEMHNNLLVIAQERYNWKSVCDATKNIFLEIVKER